MRIEFGLRPNNHDFKGGLVVWADSGTIEWDMLVTATLYHVYFGIDPSLVASFVCGDDGGADLTATARAMTSTPAPGTVEFILVTAEDVSGFEGTFGSATCAQRTVPERCP